MNFREYIENEEIEVLMERGARLFSQSGLDHEVFIEEFVKQHGLSEDWNDFWSGVKNRAGQAWNTVKNLAPVKAATGVVNHALGDKYSRSLTALKDLHQFLTKNPNAESVVSKNKTNMSVTDYIGELIKNLQHESDIAYLANGAGPEGLKRGPDMSKMMKQWQDKQGSGAPTPAPAPAPAAEAEPAYGGA
jgi:hypothetical protein